MARIIVQLVAITNSQQKGLRKSNNGLIFHVVLPNGKYGQYCISKKSSRTLNLVCCDKNCRAVLTIECPYLVAVGFRNKRRVFDLDDSIERDVLRDASKWGKCYHQCSRFCKPSCKFVHIESCSKTSNRPTWYKRNLVDLVKEQRKIDESSEPRQIASTVIETVLIQQYGTDIPADARFQLDIDEKHLRKVVYNINQRSMRSKLGRWTSQKNPF